MDEIIIEEMRRLFEQYNSGSMILDIIYNIVTFMMLIVSIFSFSVTWKVYHQSEVMHKENMDLTRKMHADSLTPYVVIKSAYNYVCFKTDKFPEMKIDKIKISDNICLNDVVEIKIDELKGKISIEVNLFNMSDIPAEIKLQYKCLDCVKVYNEYLVGKEEKVIKIEDDILTFNAKTLEETINSHLKVMYDLSYYGPGMSAIDTVSGEIKLHYNSKGNTNNSIVKQLSRDRKYD